MIVLRSPFILDDIFIKDAVGSVEIHNRSLILIEEYYNRHKQK